MKIAITGSRKFKNYECLVSALSALLPTEIIAGGAKGADTLAERYADEYGIRKKICLPRFKTEKTRYHPGHYHERNRKIVDCAEIVLAFWDGSDGGTKSTMDYAKKQNKPLLIVRF